jgi:hypothetical protein
MDKYRGKYIIYGWNDNIKELLILVHHIFLEFNKKAAAPRGLNYR